jgi:hypothetical protein
MVRFYWTIAFGLCLWATIWSQSPLLVIGSFTQEEARNAPEVLERLQEYLSDRTRLQTEADTLGYTLVWDGEVGMLFPKTLTTESRESHAATFAETLLRELQVRGYRPGQVITVDEISREAVEAFTNLMTTDQSSSLRRWISEGTVALSVDVIIAPRMRSGASIAFKSVDSVPMLSHLPENAAVASRSLDECLAKWQAKSPEIGAASGESRTGHEAAGAHLANVRERALLSAGQVLQASLHFSRSIRVEEIDTYVQKYWKQLQRMRQEVRERLQRAEAELAKWLLQASGFHMDSNFTQPVSLSQLPLPLQQLVLRSDLGK